MIMHIVKGELSLWEGCIPLFWMRTTDAANQISKGPVGHLGLSISLWIARGAILKVSCKFLPKGLPKLAHELTSRLDIMDRGTP